MLAALQRVVGKGARAPPLSVSPSPLRVACPQPLHLSHTQHPVPRQPVPPVNDGFAARVTLSPDVGTGDLTVDMTFATKEPLEPAGAAASVYTTVASGSVW